MATATITNRLNPAEHALLHEQLHGKVPRLMLRTDTRVDTGRWLGRTRLWLCVLNDELLLFAASRRRYAERVALAHCRESRYSHTAGALVIRPCDRLRFSSLVMSPSDALRVVDMIHQTPDNPQTKPSSAPENELA